MTVKFKIKASFISLYTFLGTKNGVMVTVTMTTSEHRLDCTNHCAKSYCIWGRYRI